MSACASAPSPASGETPQWLTCPNELELDLRPDRDREISRIRDIAPSAGAQTSAELAAFGHLPRLAYELYDTFDAGGDLDAAFAASGLTLVGYIYGDPGPDTERPGPRPPRRDGHTFYGFVADEPATGRRLVVFRGTLQPAEWVRNLQVRQRPFSDEAPNARVHAGFLAIAESLELEEAGVGSPLAEALPRLTAAGETVFVGHSLGSAIATLVAVAASRQSPERAEQLRVVTFASPRVGNEAFVALAQNVGQIDRVCNQVDAVTNVPPSTRFIPYVHVGELFPVSSFDWPGLDNDLDAEGEQLLCWHSDQAYAYMTAPDKDASSLGACAATPGSG